MASTTKKVLVRRFDRDSLTGFVNPLSYLQPMHLELLRQDGEVALVPYSEIKDVCFIRDFTTESAVAAGPDKGAKIFMNRPKLEGLWARMVFRDGEIQDGILPNNLLAWDIYGYTVTPPEPDSNNQKVFIPRQALRSIQVLGVVGSPLRDKKKKKTLEAEQPTLF